MRPWYSRRTSANVRAHDGRDEQQEQQRAVARALRGDRRQHQPAVGGHFRADAVAHQDARHRIDQGDHGGREEPEQHASGRQPDQARALDARGVVRARERGLARLAEEDHAEELDHHVAAERGHERDAGGDHREQHVHEGAGQPEREQEALQQQPLGDEAVQRRQPGRGERAGQREPADPRHGAQQPAELAEVALAGGVQHGPGAEEQQALEEGVVQRVVEHGRERERGERRRAVPDEQQRESHADQQQADVLDRRVGEQALHVGLHGAEDHAEQRGRQSEHDRQHAPPPQLRLQDLEADAQDPVDRRLQHHAAHQRRHRRRRRGVRFRQPDVQRQHAGLGAEAEQRQQERGRRPERRQVLRAHVGERVVAGVGLQHAEGEQDAERADVRDEQVEVAGAADRRDRVVRGHQEEGRQRHQFPHHHEDVGVVGHHHHRHAGDEEVIEQAQQPGRRAFALPEVAGSEDRDAGAGAPEQEQEERREGVEPQVEGQARQPDRQHRDLRRGEEPRHGDGREQQAHQRAERKQHARHEEEARRPRHARRTDEDPEADGDQDAVDRQQLEGEVHGRRAGSAPHRLARSGQQPGRQRAVAGVLDDVFADQLPHDLRGREVLRRADLLEQRLLARVEQQGQARRLAFGPGRSWQSHCYANCMLIKCASMTA